MTSYNDPITDMQFLLEKVFNAEDTWSSFSEIKDHVDLDTAKAILDESSKICRELIYPINHHGDEQGVRFIDQQVITPDGYKEAYQEFSEGGWIGLCGDPALGGMGMPKMLGVLIDEMGYSASNAFTLYGSLTAGAALCIHAHGSDYLKNKYLPKLYSGEWAGAMDMTEPQAGSDLRNIRTKAVPQTNGSYLITGSKIFITGGDQDLTSNIIHLVLAKLPNSNGISLFLVPKIQVDDNGSLLSENGVTVGSIEHKMGIKASATCVMNFDSAEGYLIGEVDRGLACMFTMMNYERLAIGIQGLGTSQAAYQMASDYAKERIQGKGIGTKSTHKSGDPIIVHGDVRRMLLTIKTMTEAGRALAVYTGKQLDLAKYTSGEKQVKASKYVGLLTPVAKAFLTDRGLEAAITAQQVFGGHGYICETGIEQLVRDTRIAQIYEGTNGIQALDFLGRKVIGDDVKALTEFIDDHKVNLAALKQTNPKYISKVTQLFDQLLDVSHSINSNKATRPALINACAVDFLDAFGYIVYGYFWCLMLDVAKSNTDKEFAQQKQYLTDFYFSKIIFKAECHLAQVAEGDESIMAMPLNMF